MAGIVDNPSRLLCNESHDLCFHDLDAGGSIAADPNLIAPEPDPAIIRVPEITEGMFAVMLEIEKEYLPKEGYLSRLRSGELDINFRREASDWISKAHSHYSFGPLSFCLSMNYLDRFLSLYDLPRAEAWAVQLLAVACLSIAVKMEETDIPPTLELQVGSPKFTFQGKTILKMELLVLSMLNWQMNALTPSSFVIYFLSKISDHNPVPRMTMDTAYQLILATIRALDFLRFKPSEVAAAVAISVFGTTEMQTVSIDKVMSSSSASSCIHVEKIRVMQCIALIKDMSLMSKCNGEESPNAVLQVSNSSESSHGNCKRKRNQI
ncbi:hypothetical protein V2J09_009151 [Rumex salicifolius]